MPLHIDRMASRDTPTKFELALRVLAVIAIAAIALQVYDWLRACS